MYLTEYHYGDIEQLSTPTEEHLIGAYEDDPDIYLRTFCDESGAPFAVGMCAKTGEIGLITDQDRITSPKEFYVLVVVFCAEAFAHSGADKLFTGFNDTCPGSTRWRRFLGMQRADEQLQEHTTEGLTTYEFPLSNWVR